MKKNSFRRDNASKPVDVSSSGSEDRGLADRHGTLESDMTVATTLRGSGQEQKGKDSYVSEARVLANRRNALESTGPKDTSLTRFNALKHGLSAGVVVVLPQEDPREYAAIVEALRHDFRPETATEEILIQQMASSLWRRQRLVGAERAEIEEKLVYAPGNFDGQEKSRRESDFWSRLNPIIPNPDSTAEAEQEQKVLRETVERRKQLFTETRMVPELDALRIRYESHLERQYYRSLVMLLKIQAAKQGRAET
jgi:hypothetical protein